MRLVHIYLLATAVAGVNDPEEFVWRKLFPGMQSYASRKALIDSFLWNHYLVNDADLTPEDLAFYLEDSDTVLVPNERKKSDLVSAGKKLLGLSSQKVVAMTEIDLGNEIYHVGAEYFPLVTSSAEYSSGISVVETEVGETYRIRFNPSVNRAIGAIGLSVTTTLGVTFATDQGERTTITCMANAGGKVQVQATNRMLHFPEAQTRNVVFLLEKRDFISEKWEKLKSAVAGEERNGALFYDKFELGKHRCVTDASHFEDASLRQWIEYSTAYQMGEDGDNSDDENHG